jgi:hypothetical protein
VASLIRRALGAVALAVGVAAALRLAAKSSVAPRRGGWRPLEGPEYR